MATGSSSQQNGVELNGVGYLTRVERGDTEGWVGSVRYVRLKTLGRQIGVDGGQGPHVHRSGRGHSAEIDTGDRERGR